MDEEKPDDREANDPETRPIVTPEPGGDDALYAVVSTVSGSLNLRRDALPGSPVLARIPKERPFALTSASPPGVGPAMPASPAM